jgi:hypothetical protein
MADRQPPGKLNFNVGLNPHTSTNLGTKAAQNSRFNSRKRQERCLYKKIAQVEPEKLFEN